MSATVSTRVADLLTAHGQGHLLGCLHLADQAYADGISKLDLALLASLFRGENLAPAPDLSALEPPPVAPAGMVKFSTAAELVPTFETDADDPAAPVVTVPTAIVAACPGEPCGPVAPVAPGAPGVPAGETVTDVDADGEPTLTPIWSPLDAVTFGPD